MAAREGQGLQIAVIIFAMLTIILAITTYIFYAQSQSADRERQTAVTSANQKQSEINKYLYRLKAYQYVLGREGVTEPMVKEASGAAGADNEVDALLKEFESDKALVGTQVADGQVASYRTMSAVLLAALNKKNASVADANDQINKTQADKAASEAREKARADTADAAVATASADLAKEKEGYLAERTRINAEKTKLAADSGEKDKRYKTQLDSLEKERGSLQADQVKATSTIEQLQQQRKELQSERVNLFEAPDGKIAWVNQRQRLVWIDAGRADGLMRQTTFSVFDHGVNGITNAEPKGRIEVVRLSDEHMAECRILEDTPANPILPGDVIHTPTWSPGQRLHFAMAGVMDIDGDRIDDYGLVKNIITLNGGVIDAELRSDGTRVGNVTPETRYLVLGEPPDAKSSEKALQEFTKIQDDVLRFGTDKITVQKLLTQMGWKAEERTVEMAGGGSGTAFRARKPGQKAAAPPKPGEGAAPAEPAPAEGAAPAAPAAPAADPFSAPAADPFSAPAAAPGAGTPRAPAAPAAPVADPFAPPK